MTDAFAVLAGIIGVCLAVVLLLLAIFLPIRQLDHHYGVINCNQFTQQTGRETKWADYNFWSYDCLARTSDGHWLPTDQLRDITD